MQMGEEYSSSTIKVFPSVEKHACIAQIQLTTLTVLLCIYICFIVPGTSSTNGYLGMREGKKDLEAKDPNCI